MTLQEVLTGGGGIAVIVLALIEVSPIKINPLGAIAKAIGWAINQDVLEKVSSLEDKLKHEYADVSVCAEAGIYKRCQYLKYTWKFLRIKC